MIKKLLHGVLAFSLLGASAFAAVDPNRVQIEAVKEEIDREQGECICKPRKECKKICLACKKDDSCCNSKKSMKKDGKSKKNKKEKKKRNCGTKMCSKPAEQK